MRLSAKVPTAKNKAERPGIKLNGIGKRPQQKANMDGRLDVKSAS